MVSFGISMASGLRWGPTVDEDETVEITTFGGGYEVLHVGLDWAELRARSAYIRGHIEVDAFEREVERIMCLREEVRARLT
jgi:hypothetical protein